HLDGKLTLRPAALELQPWDDPMTGLQPDIDERGDFISIGGKVYVRTNTLNAWQVVSADDPYWSLFVNINPAGWADASSAQTLGPIHSGSVTVRDLTFDCVGTALRHPAPHDKFVLEVLAFADAGHGSISIDPSEWRLYGDGVDGVRPTTIGASDELHAQTLTQ